MSSTLPTPSRTAALGYAGAPAVVADDVHLHDALAERAPVGTDRDRAVEEGGEEDHGHQTLLAAGRRCRVGDPVGQHEQHDDGGDGEQRQVEQLATTGARRGEAREAGVAAVGRDEPLGAAVAAPVPVEGRRRVADGAGEARERSSANTLSRNAACLTIRVECRLAQLRLLRCRHRGRGGLGGRRICRRQRELRGVGGGGDQDGLRQRRVGRRPRCRGRLERGRRRGGSGGRLLLRVVVTGPRAHQRAGDHGGDGRTPPTSAPGSQPQHAAAVAVRLQPRAAATRAPARGARRPRAARAPRRGRRGARGRDRALPPTARARARHAGVVANLGDSTGSRAIGSPRSGQRQRAGRNTRDSPYQPVRRGAPPPRRRRARPRRQRDGLAELVRQGRGARSSARRWASWT